MRLRENWSFKKINKQLIVLLCSILLVYLMFNMIPVYKWEHKNLLEKNIMLAKKYEGLVLEKKLVGKLGMDVQLLLLIREKTPDDAIIIMPPKNIFRHGQAKKEFDKITYKNWASYFVYPRELVYEDEKNENPLYSQATHLAIAYYWGYSKVAYKVSNRKKFTVLPLKKSWQR